MSNRQNLSNWLQTELHSRNWTQSELARVSGLHRAIISKIVLQGSDPTPETLEAIAKALKLPPEQWMATENPLVVNGVLTRLCQKITITPAGEISIHFQQ